MASTNKKAWILHRDGRRWQGYLDPDSLPDTDPIVWLDLKGQMNQAEQSAIFQVWMVRDFQEALPLGRKKFSSRPRQSGLWVQLQYKEGETAEALLANDLLQPSRHGFTLTPPGGTARLYVPRAALQKITILGVIGARPARPAGAAAGQIQLFPVEESGVAKEAR